MLSREVLAGTFIKTPAHEIIEVLVHSGLDFVALDAEHAGFDRCRLDACLAVANALNFPTLVRVPSSSASDILMALDAGANGVIVPHVDSVEKARDVARSSRFGHGGRGYAGSTRWAGFATRKMPELLEKSKNETIVIAQIEEPEGVHAIDDIAAVKGIDGLFVGPADLAVCMGTTDIAAPEVRGAIKTVADTCQKLGKCCMTFAPSTADAPSLRDLGVTVFFVGSEHAMMLAGARQIAAELQGMKS